MKPAAKEALQGALVMITLGALLGALLGYPLYA